MLAMLLLMPFTVFVLLFYLKHFGDILTGVYILFPLCFIVQALFISKRIHHLISAYVFASAILLILTNLWYNVADSFGCVINYWIFGVVAYAVKKIIVNKRV